MCVTWNNPYENCGTSWVKGNVHAHFSPQSRCASISPHELALAYSQRGYRFLGISNHMCLPEEQPLVDGGGLLTLPGIEWNSRTAYMANESVTYQDHYGIYCADRKVLAQCLAAKKPEDLLAACRDRATVFSVMHHPNWLFPPHTSLEALLAYGPRVSGLEMYNAVVERERGNAVATHNWDVLLGNGVRILGVVGDDAHRLADIGKAWLMVSVDHTGGVDPQTVMASLVRGRFYCSTGVYFESIQREADTLRVTTAEECRLRVSTDFGAVAHEVKGRSIEWTFSGGCSYARVTADGACGVQAWTQPFFFDPRSA